MSKGNRIKHTFRLPPDLSRQLADYAGRKRVSQASVVEAAVSSFLSPDGSERMEAAFSRRLDRISRQLDKLDYHVEVGNELLPCLCASGSAWLRECQTKQQLPTRLLLRGALSASLKRWRGASRLANGSRISLIRWPAKRPNPSRWRPFLDRPKVTSDRPYVDRSNAGHSGT